VYVSSKREREKKYACMYISIAGSLRVIRVTWSICRRCLVSSAISCRLDLNLMHTYMSIHPYTHVYIYIYTHPKSHIVIVLSAEIMRRELEFTHIIIGLTPIIYQTNRNKSRKYTYTHREKERERGTRLGLGHAEPKQFGSVVAR